MGDPNGRSPIFIANKGRVYDFRVWFQTTESKSNFTQLTISVFKGIIVLITRPWRYS